MQLIFIGTEIVKNVYVGIKCAIKLIYFFALGFLSVLPDQTSCCSEVYSINICSEVVRLGIRAEQRGIEIRSRMHLSENEGIEGKTLVVTGGLGFVGSALCLELVRRGAHEVRAFDLRDSSPWFAILKDNGVRCIQGWLVQFSFSFLCFLRLIRLIDTDQIQSNPIQKGISFAKRMWKAPSAVPIVCSTLLLLECQGKRCSN